MKLVTLIIVTMCSSVALAQTPAKSKTSLLPGQKPVTEMDFDSTMIDGKMKAPSGFFLQGRNKQSLQSMVQLRSTFRDRLRNSKSAVKAIIK